MPGVYEMGSGEYSVRKPGIASRVKKFLKKLIQKLLARVLQAIKASYGSIPMFALAMAKIAAGAVTPKLISIAKQKLGPKAQAMLERKFQKLSLQQIQKLIDRFQKLLPLIEKVFPLLQKAYAMLTG